MAGSTEPIRCNSLGLLAPSDVIVAGMTDGGEGLADKGLRPTTRAWGAAKATCPPERSALTRIDGALVN